MGKITPETCPGINKLVRPVPEYFKCSTCGGEIELWSDEEVTKCPNCDRDFRRPEKQAFCLDWCEYADACRDIIKQRKK
ncbi:MAG: hypothetical protein ABIH76_01975 [Candidatus Bathyarchaeota archaeon]